MPRLSRLLFSLLCLSLLATVHPADSGAYTIQAGDTPVSIAKKHGISVNDLMRANKGLDARKIQVGGTLTIPGESSAKSSKKRGDKDSKKERTEKKTEKPSEKERASSHEKTKESKGKTSGSYTVKKGDTLGSIAAKHDISVDDILKANKSLKPSKMRIGQELTLPGIAPAKTEPAAKSPHKAEKSRESQEDTTTYSAHKRDTVDSVARKFHISVKELRRLNPDMGKKLHSGQRLTVPKAEEAAPQSPAKSEHTRPAPTPSAEPEAVPERPTRSEPQHAKPTPAQEAAPETEPERPAKSSRTPEPEAAPAKSDAREASDAEAAFEKGIEFGKQNKFQKAVESFDKAIKLNSTRADFYASRGHAHYYMKQYNKAIDDYTKAIEKNPNFALAYSMRGLSRTRSGQYQQAIEDFNKAIKFGSNEADYYKGRGFTYLHLKQYGPMCQDYQKACSLGDCELLDSAKKEKLCQ